MPNSKKEKRLCSYCRGTGKIKKPNDEEAFDQKFDLYADKSYFINLNEANEKALRDVGYTLIDCPFCSHDK